MGKTSVLRLPGGHRSANQTPQQDGMLVVCAVGSSSLLPPVP